ncbi:MAG: radical SAM family heme chaperone HemW [Erysipelotrichaceae bacterium]|nr:radical SAM family heme chaperone HemW [Erysipelotrichaceae bacterium]
MKTEALYIHIPFCDHICSYCDFPKVFYNKTMVDRYLACLSKELSDIHGSMRTVYIGGGTPSSLTIEQLSLLMSMIQPYLSEKTVEVTMEVNPESMNREKLELIYQSGVSRLSIGVETFNDHLLQKIDRHHTKSQVLKLLEEAVEVGFTNISIDMMYGLPEQSITDVHQDLMVIKDLSMVTHVSYYALILEPHTKLANANYEALDEDLDYQINLLIDDSLTSFGFHQYEVSNYARGDYESEHNKAYWHYDNYYGAGVGATGKIDEDLIVHSRSLTRYLKNESIISVEKQSSEDTMFNHLMMSLRLNEGLNLEEFKRRYHVDCLDYYHIPLKKHLEQGTLVLNGHYLSTTKESQRYLNSILIDFLD